MSKRLTVLLVATVAAGGLAHADAAHDAQAKAAYEAGTTAFNLGEWSRAVDEYKKAYTLKPEPVLLYDIAQAYRLANDLPNALFFYRSYLHNEPNPPNRPEIVDRIRKLEQQIHDQQQVATQPPNTPAPMERGREAGHPVSGETAPPAATAPAPAAVSRAAAAPAATPAPTWPALQLTASPTTPPRERTPLYRKWWLWTAVGGVIAVGVGVGVGLALTANSAPSSHLGTTGVF